MAIRQEADGTWTALYSKRHPKWKTPISMVRKKLASKAEATRVLNELMNKVHQKIAERTTPSWQKCVEGHVDEMSLNGYTEKTIHSEYVCIKKYTSQWNSRQIESISSAEILAIINGMTENTVGYKKYILKCIRGVFNHAVDHAYIQRNPTPRLKLKAPDKIMPVLTEAQAVHLLTQARDLNNEWYPHWCVAIFTGMRNGELYALRKNKVNLEDRLIVVDESWNSKDGFKSTKSGDDRVLEIPLPLIPVLKNLMVSDSEFVLPRNILWKRGEQARCLRKFLIGINLPAVRFHDLRATWATMLLSKGTAPAVVMKMGGWKDMETMMIYMRKAGIDIKGATKCLDDVFSPIASTNNVIQLHKK